MCDSPPPPPGRSYLYCYHRNNTLPNMRTACLRNLPKDGGGGSWDGDGVVVVIMVVVVVMLMVVVVVDGGGVNKGVGGGCWRRC